MSLRGGHSLPTYDWARALRRLPGLVCTLEADGRIVAVTGRLYDEDPDVLELTHVWGLAAEAHREELRQAVAQVVETREAVQLLVDSSRTATTFLVEVSPGDPHLAMVWLTVSDAADRAEAAPAPVPAPEPPPPPPVEYPPSPSDDGLLWIGEELTDDPPTVPAMVDRQSPGTLSPPAPAPAPAPLRTEEPRVDDDFPDFLPFDFPDLGGSDLEALDDEPLADPPSAGGSLLRQLKTDHGLDRTPRPMPDRAILGGPAPGAPGPSAPQPAPRDSELEASRTERGAMRRDLSPPPPPTTSGRPTLSWAAPVPSNPPGPVTVKGPAPRRAPAERAGLPLDYVIVAPARLRRLAARLQRTLDLVTPRNVVWFDDEFDANVHRLGTTTRVVFLGPSKYGDFMRKVVAPRFDEAGACWGMMKRKALIWIHDEGDEIAVARRLDSARSKATKPRAVLIPSDKPPSAKELAGKFLFEPRPGVPDLLADKYLLGTAMFLLEGFEEFHAAVEGEA